MKKYLSALLIAWLAIAQPAMALSNITGFNNRNTGDTITASIWNNEIGGVYTYINSTIISTLNGILSKGRILTSDGTNISPLTNAGAGDNGKVLTLDNGEALGVKWAAPGGIGYTTKGDMSYYDSGNQRLGIGTTDQILKVSASGLPTWANNTSNIPAGLIAIWPGPISTIPSGWALCDGQNGTPNLQGLMIVGAGNHSPAAPGGFGLIAEGNVSGSTTHTHSFSDTSSVNSTATTNVTLGGAGTVAANNHTHNVSGTTGSTSSRPASVAFPWIMKL